MSVENENITFVPYLRKKPKKKCSSKSKIKIFWLVKEKFFDIQTRGTISRFFWVGDPRLTRSVGKIKRVLVFFGIFDPRRPIEKQKDIVGALLHANKPIKFWLTNGHNL